MEGEAGWCSVEILSATPLFMTERNFEQTNLHSIEMKEKKVKKRLKRDLLKFKTCFKVLESFMTNLHLTWKN